MFEIHVREISDLISKHELLCKERTRFANHLDISGDVLEPWNVQYTNCNMSPSEFFNNVLLKWQTAKGREATVLQVRNVLRTMGQNSVADSLEDYILRTTCVVEIDGRKSSLLSNISQRSDDMVLQDDYADSTSSCSGYASGCSGSGGLVCLSKSEIKKKMLMLDAYFRKGKFMEAANQFEEILRLIPQMLQTSEMEKEYEYLERTVNSWLISRKKFEDGKIYLVELLEGVNRNLGDGSDLGTFIKAKMGHCLEELGELEGAQHYYTEALCGFQQMGNGRAASETKANAKRVADAIAQLCGNVEQS